MITSPSPLVGLSCARHPWCVRETVALAHDGSPARFHHGVPTDIQAGDDHVTVALISSDDDTDASYLEVEATDASHRRDSHRSVWLTADEACALLTALEATLGQIGECPLGP